MYSRTLLTMGLLLLVTSLIPSTSAFAQATALHYFMGGVDDGRVPWSNNALYHDGKLYGMTRWGGDSDLGVLFRIEADGTGYTHLHEFGGAVADGREPHNSLILVDSTLYGMALSGGTDGCGTIFRMNLDGSGYQTIHNFTGGWDGNSPHGDVLHVNGHLYGLTRWGGTHNIGTIFRCDMSGGNFTVLHSFGDIANDGNRGHFGILHVAGMLYGQTWIGGINNHGTIWRCDTTGADYEVLHSFYSTTDGYHAHGYLIMAGGWLYGMSPEGGEAGNGTAYRIRPDGSDFEVLHAFGSFPQDGTTPLGEFLDWEGRLWGCTPGGGEFGSGTIFTMDYDGGNYEIRYNFNGTFGGPTANSLELGADGYMYGLTGGCGTGCYGAVYKYSPLPLVLDIDRLSPEQVRLSWNSTPYSNYQLLHSLEAYPEEWEILDSLVAGNGGILTRPDSVQVDEKFYQVRFLE
jgi:uncharacterized repeat protein (TIGR03803 family)